MFASPVKICERLRTFADVRKSPVKVCECLRTFANVRMSCECLRTFANVRRCSQKSCESSERNNFCKTSNLQLTQSIYQSINLSIYLMIIYITFSPLSICESSANVCEHLRTFANVRNSPVSLRTFANVRRCSQKSCESLRTFANVRRYSQMSCEFANVCERSQMFADVCRCSQKFCESL